MLPAYSVHYTNDEIVRMKLLKAQVAWERRVVSF